ncbi:MAG: DUF370 domain-containing protein [Clostridiaceae bacterium]|nr:DUF370 domain-containing protein [Clostridiaceae bacterium]
MYVHIGKDTVILLKEIIIILNLEKSLKNNNIEDILKNLNIEKNIINISENNNKSLIIIKRKEKLIGYITNISSITLEKRIQK